MTGAAGFIGSHLAERLVSEGHEVVAVDAFTDYYDPERKRANFSVLADHDGGLVEGDLNQLDLERLIGDLEVVFHLAGQPGVRASWGESFDIYLDQNVLATQRLREGSPFRSPMQTATAIDTRQPVARHDVAIYLPSPLPCNGAAPTQGGGAEIPMTFLARELPAGVWGSLTLCFLSAPRSRARTTA